MNIKIRVAIITLAYVVAPWFFLLLFKHGANGPAASFDTPLPGEQCIRQYFSFDSMFFSRYSGWFYSSWLPFFVIGIADILQIQKGNRKLFLSGGLCMLVLFLAWTSRCATASIGTVSLFSLYQFFIGWGIAHTVEKWHTYSRVIRIMLLLLLLLFMYELIGFVHVFLVHYP